MPGPAPKHPSVRARRNRSATASTLRASASVVAPDLPEAPPSGVAWHPSTLAWWADLWASPMAPEYDASDRHGLFMLAILVDDFWRAETSKERRELMVRLESGWKLFGTAPLPRRSLQWEIERAESAQEEGSRRRRGRGSATPETGAPDPREVLRGLDGGKATAGGVAS